MSETYLSLFRGEITRPEPTTMKAIAETVAAAHGLTLDDLKGPSRFRRVAWARQEAMWRMRQIRTRDGLWRYSLPMIGAFLGGRDHTTIMSGVRAHDRRLADAQERAE